jgi:hypothetical protein
MRNATTHTHASFWHWWHLTSTSTTAISKQHAKRLPACPRESDVLFGWRRIRPDSEVELVQDMPPLMHGSVAPAKLRNIWVVVLGKQVVELNRLMRNNWSCKLRMVHEVDLEKTTFKAFCPKNLAALTWHRRKACYCRRDPPHGNYCSSSMECEEDHVGRNDDEEEEDYPVVVSFSYYSYCSCTVCSMFFDLAVFFMGAWCVTC